MCTSRKRISIELIPLERRVIVLNRRVKISEHLVAIAAPVQRHKVAVILQLQGRTKILDRVVDLILRAENLSAMHPQMGKVLRTLRRNVELENTDTDSLSVYL
jgi:hypothetical protein